MFYELHVSDIAPGKRSVALSLFTDSILGYFHKHGINPMTFCEAEFGGPSDQIVYLIPWESLAAYQHAWDGFRADTEWQIENDRASRDGTIFLRTTKTLLREMPSIMAHLTSAGR